MYYAKYRVSRKPRKIFRYIFWNDWLDFDFQTHFLFQTIIYNLSFLGFKVWIVEKYIEDIFFRTDLLKEGRIFKFTLLFLFFSWCLNFLLHFSRVNYSQSILIFVTLQKELNPWASATKSSFEINCSLINFAKV